MSPFCLIDITVLREHATAPRQKRMLSVRKRLAGQLQHVLRRMLAAQS